MKSKKEFGHNWKDMNDMDWACPKKQKARSETIIEKYRKNFQYSLPQQKQYWTICGKCANDDGTLHKGSELFQILDNNLIRPQQFHGVEIDPKIHQLNIQCPQKVNWYCGDFYTAMAQAENFNPGIVNADLLHMPQTGAEYFSKVMALVDFFTDAVMLIGNFILRNRHMMSKADAIISELDQHAQFHAAYDDGNWQFGDQCYVYNGTGKNITVMGTVVFYKG